MKKVLPFIILLILACQAHAAMNVYFYMGKVYMVENGKTGPIAAVNELVSDNASLKLEENSEAILRNSDGQYAIFKKAGDYNPAKIKEAFAEQKGKNLVESMAGFLGDEFASKHVDIRKMSQSYMRQKGGVTRQGSVYPLMTWPPYGSASETNKVKFVWSAMPGIKKYEFVVYGSEDPNNPVQLSKSLETDTTMDVDFSDFGKDKDAYFSWVAYPEGDPNYTRYTFKIITSENLKKITNEADAEAAKETTAENKLLVKAVAYEKAGLLSYAEKSYQDLLAKNKASIYDELYKLFQIRNSLAKQ